MKASRPKSGAGATRDESSARAAEDPIVPDARLAMADFFVKTIATLQTNVEATLSSNTGSPLSELVQAFTRTMLLQLAQRAGTTLPGAASPGVSPAPQPAPAAAPAEPAAPRKPKPRRTRRRR